MASKPYSKFPSFVLQKVIKNTITAKWKPLQFCRKEQGGCQKIVSPLRLYSQAQPKAETVHVSRVDRELKQKERYAKIMVK